MTALRPLLVSTGLHAILLLIIAAVPLGATATQQNYREIMVELIEMALPVVKDARVHEPAAVSQAVEAKRPSLPRPDTYTRHSASVAPRTPRDMGAQVQPVQTPSVAQAAANFESSAAQSLPGRVANISSGAPAPEFIDVRASIRGSYTTGSRETLGAAPELGSSILAVSDVAGLPPMIRPTLALASSRVLRDPIGDFADNSSQVRAGDNLRPEYPHLAREAGWEGTVMLRVEVLPDGKAGKVTVHRTSGHTLLDQAALIAVEKWRFMPAMNGNFPIRSVVQLPIRFDLKFP